MDNTRSPAELLSGLKLQERLDRAMSKAGVSTPVRLEPSFVHLDYYDVSGLQVHADDPALRARAAAWVVKALTAAGVKEWHTGAWHGPCVMGDPRVIEKPCYGKDITLVRLETCSIGD